MSHGVYGQSTAPHHNTTRRMRARWRRVSELTGNLGRKGVGYFFDIGDVLIFSTTACPVRSESATAARPARRRSLISIRNFAPHCFGEKMSCDGPVIADYVPTFWACMSNIFQTIDAEWDQAATETTSYHAQERNPCSQKLSSFQRKLYASAMQ